LAERVENNAVDRIFCLGTCISHNHFNIKQINLIFNFKEDYVMNKTDLVAKMAEASGLSKKDAEKALKAFEDVVTAELVAGGDVRLVGFGTFDVKERAEHEGINPQTKNKIVIPASKSPRFKVGKALKDAVNK
jgi:DNA-binding protein HU-beta